MTEFKGCQAYGMRPPPPPSTDQLFRRLKMEKFNVILLAQICLECGRERENKAVHIPVNLVRFVIGEETIA